MENNDKKGRSKRYFLYLIFVLILVQVLDSYITSYPTLIPSRIIAEFLYDFPENIGESIFTLITGLASIGMYVCALNTFMSDKFGRKVMLSITVFGMVIICLLLIFTTSIIDFTIYLFFLWFFTRSDIWIIFINEESSKERRASYTNLIIIFGLIGAILAPILRSILITETSPIGSWRALSFFPIILGIPLGLLILFTLKEPTIYSDIKDPEKNLHTQISLRENIKSQLNSPNRKSLLASLVVSFILGLNVIFRNLVEQELSTSEYLTSPQVSIIMLVGVFAVIFAAIIMGTLADKIGRLPLLYIFSLLIPIGRILFVIFVNTPISFVSSMIFVGISEIGYWGGWVTISIVILELIPTESRGTGSGLKSFFGAMGITVGLLSASLITLFYGLPIAFIVIGLMSLINLPLIYKYLKETKQVDMKDVYGVK
ncbi:MAG: membrane protein of unknown function [Promethearchaeota archaeon]|nr:MAG: membrane protein of unknown function [Candidatus Lokiarchaeota archaeon]